MTCNLKVDCKIKKRIQLIADREKQTIDETMCEIIFRAYQCGDILEEDLEAINVAER
jgi:hypothetical protein